jgi:hypothetical protein
MNSLYHFCTLDWLKQSLLGYKCELSWVPVQVLCAGDKLATIKTGIAAMDPSRPKVAAAAPPAPLLTTSSPLSVVVAASLSPPPPSTPTTVINSTDPLPSMNRKSLRFAALAVQQNYYVALNGTANVKQRKAVTSISIKNLL